MPINGILLCDPLVPQIETVTLIFFKVINKLNKYLYILIFCTVL